MATHRFQPVTSVVALISWVTEVFRTFFLVPRKRVTPGRLFFFDLVLKSAKKEIGEFRNDFISKKIVLSHV